MSLAAWRSRSETISCSTTARFAASHVAGLPFGLDAIPAYAGTRQRTAQVIVENEGGRPVQILDVTGHFWEFDDEGKIDVSLRESLKEWMDVAFDDPSRRRQAVVVDLVPDIKKRELYDRHRWTPTSDEVDRIAADIWPGITGPAPDVETVKGKAPRRPPLSYSAKYALQDIAREVAIIQQKLSSLTEHDLRGLAFEAIRTASFEDEALWRGIAEEAKRFQAIAAAHRTGKGDWYAVVEAVRIESEHIVANITTAYVKCGSRKEAVTAGRKLLVEKADWLSEDINLEVTLYSALEWQPFD